MENLTKLVIHAALKIKKVIKKKKQQIYAGITDKSPIEFIELYDLLLESYERESENKENVANSEFIFSCTVNIATLEGDSKEKANFIIKEISDIDKYTWIQPMCHYTCNGYVKITIHENLILSDIEITHILHSTRSDISIPSEVKQFILIYYHVRYIEHGLDINIHQKENPKALCFLTNFWNILNNSQFKVSEIGVDATYNTNNLKFELYVVHAEVDGIFIDFLLQLKILGFEPEFFITEDFAQISAAHFIWKNIKVQLCLWHIKKAVEARLSSNKISQQVNYNSIAAQQQFSFIDLTFDPSLAKEKIVFCPKEIRPLIWKIMNITFTNTNLFQQLMINIFLQLKSEQQQYKKFIISVNKILCHNLDLSIE
ncbi:hypothetical protein C1645_828514 [Glomus cerebriforme]|uniref:MULE transposase domain-containing protein n=1 Tax=Glomus cerebriforme TaxID=658196 RepID=A0A397SSN4_9GLOM|nr:hypothetical protein C1645_828514 [Glomus cerebriforme]